MRHAIVVYTAVMLFPFFIHFYAQNYSRLFYKYDACSTFSAELTEIDFYYLNYFAD